MPQNLFEVIARLSVLAGEATAAVDGIGVPVTSSRPDARTLSYRELHDASLRISKALATLLVGKDRPILATKMRRGNDWYCVFLAASRLGVPIVALSTDLRDKDTENIRNNEILASLKPSLMVVDAENAMTAALASGGVSGPVLVPFASLWAHTHAVENGYSRRISDVSPGTVLCYCYTGGTTEASRCVAITHRMALHEVATYPLIAPNMTQADRVLQQHSAFWAASTYGEFDLALAFSCALVFVRLLAWKA